MPTILECSIKPTSRKKNTYPPPATKT